MASLDSAALSALCSVISTSATVNLSRDAEYINKHLASNAERRAAWKHPTSLKKSLILVLRLTLGGGFTWLCRQHVLAIDTLFGATVVTTPGDIVPASGTESPDLLRALRGSGDGFGVVPEFVSRLREQRPVTYDAVYLLMLSTLPMMETLISEINTRLADRTITATGALVFALDRTFIIDAVFVNTGGKHFAPELAGEGGYTNYLDKDALKAS
ncbi:hypothetical protein FRC07_001412 [Ceratobasidium sp. 392]|nr:hypothetical protein FRC07_001412 [Ceratobasidium sp. 392]